MCCIFKAEQQQLQMSLTNFFFRFTCMNFFCDYCFVFFTVVFLLLLVVILWFLLSCARSSLPSSEHLYLPFLPLLHLCLFSFLLWLFPWRLSSPFFTFSRPLCSSLAFSWVFLIRGSQFQEYVNVARANRHWSISAHHDKLPVPLVKSWKQGLTRWLIEKKPQTCLCSSCRTDRCLETPAHEPNTHFLIWDVSPGLCAHVIGSEKSHWELCAPSHGLPAWSSTPVSASHGLLSALQGINTWAAAPAAPGVPGHPCLPVYSSN